MRTRKPISQDGLPADKSGGMVLILTLVVITILAVLILEFIYLMRVDLTVAGNYRDSLKALYLAKSGVNFAMVLLRKDDNNFDALNEDWSEAKLPIAEAEGVILFEITDENRKININKVIAGGKIDQKIKRLFELLEIPEELIDVIADWRDPDSEIRFHGAEDGYYSGLPNPYHCKNGPLDTVTELLLLKDFDEDIFYGKGSDRDPLSSYLTVYGDGRININTAPLIILQTLSDDIDRSLAEAIVDYRDKKPFKSIEDIKEAVGDRIYNEISETLTVRSNFFSIQAQGLSGESSKNIRAVIERGSKDLRIRYWHVG